MSSSTTSVTLVAALCEASPEAVRHACQIFGFRVYGDLILLPARKLGESFLAEVGSVEAGLRSQKRRYPGGPYGTREKEAQHEKARSSQVAQGQRGASA